jgi:hypothetical protein
MLAKKKKSAKKAAPKQKPAPATSTSVLKLKTFPQVYRAHPPG